MSTLNYDGIEPAPPATEPVQDPDWVPDDELDAEVDAEVDAEEEAAPAHRDIDDDADGADTSAEEEPR